MKMTGRVRAAVAIDVTIVVLFAVIGRRSHDDGQDTTLLTSQAVESPIGNVIRVAAPFLIALGAGWIVARAWRRPFDVVAGRTIWIVTIVLGMVLRRTVFDRGTAFSFVVVASVFTGVLLLGWRLVASRFSRGVTLGS